MDRRGDPPVVLAVRADQCVDGRVQVRVRPAAPQEAVAVQLAERVPVRNMRTIVETLAEHAGRTQDAAQLQAQVRVALGRQIVQDIAGMATELPVITLEPDLEQLLSNSLAGTNAATPGLEPGLAERMQRRLAEAAQRQELSGEPAVLLVPPQLRQTLARFMRSIAWSRLSPQVISFEIIGS